MRERKLLKVFRIREQTWNRVRSTHDARIATADGEADNRSVYIRRVLAGFCEQPVGPFVQKELKAELTVFSVRLEPELVERIGRTARVHGVSRNVLVETALSQAVA